MEKIKEITKIILPFKFVLAIVFLFTAGCTALILQSWAAANSEIDPINSSYFGEETISKSEKPAKQTVKGVYLTAFSAGSPKKIDEIISLLNKTELNAVIIDIKDYSGYVLYDSQVKEAVDLKLKKNRMPDLKATIKKLHENNIYVIARQSVFQDPVLAQKKPEWALKNRSGGIWRDRNGLSWVDPTKKEVWNYNIAIAKEAGEFGFDELNFDYIRFPSDGNMGQVVYSNGKNKKYEIMANFYKYLSSELADEPFWTSFDMFGLVMEAKGDQDMNIGQRLLDAVDNVDYIAPMMYPSHYPYGHLGLKNPAVHPALVIETGMQRGLHFFEGKRAQVRPWIQAFNMGAIYDAAKIRAQIDAVEKYTDAGWMMWNAANRYTSAGLLMEKVTSTQFFLHSN